MAVWETGSGAFSVFRRGAADRQADPDDVKGREELSRILHAISWVAGVAVLFIAVLALGNLAPGVGATGWMTVLRFIGAAVLLCAAAVMVGILVGFLFGIPRTASGADGRASGVNTNLEQISDWLTKILVGVGLTQLESLPARLWAIAGKLSVALPVSDGRQAIVVALLIYGAAAGFLTGYLLTRLFLAEALRRADRKAAMQEIATVRTIQDLAAAPQVDKLVNKLQELRKTNPDKLIELNKKPPTTQARIEEAIARADPENKRLTDHDSALQMLNFRLMMLPRTDELLKPWEKELDGS